MGARSAVTSRAASNAYVLDSAPALAPYRTHFTLVANVGTGAWAGSNALDGGALLPRRLFRHVNCGCKMPIILGISDNVAVVTISRPERRNAITFPMRAELQRIFERLTDDHSVRAIVLTGEGDHFSAGSDVTEMGLTGVIGTMHKMRHMHRMLRGIAQTNKPVIAAVRGVCIGMSWSLALASDFVIAAEDARFQFAFRHVGLAPDGGASFLLSRYVGIQRAKEIMYSGRFVGGVEAVALGLALEALPADQVLPRAQEMARELAAAPTVSLAMMKRQFDAAPGQTLDQALDFEATIQPAMVQTEDFQEGKAAFKEKRRPAYKGA